MILSRPSYSSTPTHFEVLLLNVYTMVYTTCSVKQVDATNVLNFKEK